MLPILLDGRTSMIISSKNLIFCLFSIIVIVMPTFAIADQGDINSDGLINLQDAILALQALSFETGPPDLHLTADVDGDSRIGLAEAINALQWASDLRGSLSNNSDLSGLSLSDGVLLPDFDPNILSYTVAVESNIFQISITPTAADSSASLSINSIAVPSGSASPTTAHILVVPISRPTIISPLIPFIPRILSLSLPE